MLAPYISTGKLTILLNSKVSKAEVSSNKVQALAVRNLQSGNEYWLRAPYFADATETGELLPLSGAEYYLGTESKAETGELHAPEKGSTENQQAFTLCFALDYCPGENHVIDKPEKYDFWKNYIPQLTPFVAGTFTSTSPIPTPSTLEPKKLGFHPEGGATGSVLNLWNYRKIINRHNFTPGLYSGDITIINWPQKRLHAGQPGGCKRKRI